MTILLIAFLPVALGFLLVRGLVSTGWRLCPHDWFRLVLGTGIGIGLCSECSFIGLATGLSGTLLEILLLAAFATVAFWNPKEARCCFCETVKVPQAQVTVTRYLSCALVLLLLLDLAIFGWLSARNPRGGWDAWAIWNLRARFLYRAGGAGWRDAFTEVLAWSHPDYPLLLPAFVARGWKLLGAESTAVPVSLACFFSFACAGLMAASLTILRGARQGILAGLALAATPSLYVQGAMQVADVPVAFFMLMTLACLAMADRFRSPGFAVLAGAAAALAAWTKNEGLLWLAAVLLARGVMTRGRSLPALLSGTLPVLAPVLFFKAYIATSSDILGSANRVGMMKRVLDPARYLLIAGEAVRQVRDFGPLLISAFAILAIYLVVAGLQRRNPDADTLRTGTLALLLMAFGYCATYLVHPLDLRWELNNSSGRVLLQLWPGFVFVVFLAARGETQLGAELESEMVSSSEGSLISR